MKRLAKWFGAAVVLIAVVVAPLWYSAFGRNSAIVDGAQVAPGVETVKDGFVSVFILNAGPGKVALVDAGKDSSGAAVRAALARRGLSPASVAAVFLTHGHGDHTAGCHLFPDAQVFAFQEDARLVGDACRVTHFLKEGEPTTVGDLQVEAFAVPGHTDGSAVYLARHVLFFGDSAGASNEGRIMKAVRIFSHSSDQNVASLKTLAARLTGRAAEIKALAFAHTGPLRGFEPLAAFAAE
jgi:glyoxylase-like metal-dependent hydrolase (beta-lactamase superfamily II)